MNDFIPNDSINNFNQKQESVEPIFDTLNLEEEITDEIAASQSEAASSQFAAAGDTGTEAQGNSNQSEQSADKAAMGEAAKTADALGDDENATSENLEAAEAAKSGNDSKQLSELSAKMDALTELFKAKIETDAYKNHLFDEMHKKLAIYQDDALKAVIEPFISELITLLENVKQYERFTPEEATPENYAKLRKRLADVRGDIEDILEEMDVSRYETDALVPDTKRQKIIKTVRTDDASKNNMIESKLSDGYIYRNKIIKYEKVAVYKAE